MANIKTAAFNRSLKNPTGNCTRIFRHTLVTEPAVNDELDFFKIDGKVKFIDAKIFGDQLDTGGGLEVDFVLTDGTTVYFLLASWANLDLAIPSARIGIVQLPDVFGKVLGDTARWRLYVNWSQAAGTFVPGEIGCSITYTVQDIQNNA